MEDSCSLIVVVGVAYSLPQAGDKIGQVQRWPGAGHRNDNKVPTRLVYPNGTDRPSCWGFDAEDYEQDDNVVIQEWFKTLLDPRAIEKHNKDNPDDTRDLEQVQHWVRDFLTRLYDCIEVFLTGKLPDFEWTTAKIEFLFSMPTTWSPVVVESFRGIIGQAGFGGSLNAHHTVTMSLTEAEAAAVYTSTDAPNLFKSGEVILVCDAGGGTTDLSALQVTETMVESLSLKQLKQVDVVYGANVGSAGIDAEFMKLVRQRLVAADKIESLDIDVDDAPWQMARSIWPLPWSTKLTR